jgi:hypothetical protein
VYLPEVFAILCRLLSAQPLLYDLVAGKLLLHGIKESIHLDRGDVICLPAINLLQSAMKRVYTSNKHF